MCDVETISAENKEFPRDLFDRIKPVLFKADEVNFFLIGEPTLSKDLIYFLEETRDYPFLPKLFTNGTILNDKILDIFDERGVFVNISMESANPRLYDLIRIGSTFKGFENNIRKYVAKYNSRKNDRFHLRLGCTISIDNAPEILNIIEFAKKMGIPDIFFGAMDGGWSSNRHLSCDDKKAVYYLKKGKDLASKYKIRFCCPRKINDLLIEDNNNWKEFELPIDNFINDYLEGFNPNPVTDDCGYPWAQTIFRANGDVCSCCQRKHILGNMYENTFEEIWNGQKYQALRAQKKFKNCLGIKCNMAYYSALPYQISR